MPFLRKYGTGTGANVAIPMVVAASSNYATGANWTPATGDVKISKDGATQANIATLPSYSEGDWVFVFSDAELQCKRLSVRIVDSATKAVEDSGFNIETYGHASAMIVQDLSAAQYASDVSHWRGTAVADPTTEGKVVIDATPIDPAILAADLITNGVASIAKQNTVPAGAIVPASIADGAFTTVKFASTDFFTAGTRFLTMIETPGGGIYRLTAAAVFNVPSSAFDLANIQNPNAVVELPNLIIGGTQK